MLNILKMISNLSSAEAENLLVVAGEATLKKVTSAAEWKKILVGAGQFFIENEKEADQFFDDLSLVLSKENMAQLAKNLKGTDGYELKRRFTCLLMRLMSKYEIPHELAEPYCQRMLYVFLEQIKAIDPAKYDQYFQQEWRDDVEKSFKSIDAKLEKISADTRLYHENRLNVLAAGQMDLELRKQTEVPSIGIDFFQVDDEVFQKNFRDRLHDELIYVKGKCREETIYCILNELWKLEEPRPIYVVRSMDSWEKLRELSPDGNIFIPWFCAESIVAIEHNTNIFVLNENMPAYARRVIELRPRTYDTLSRCLVEAGMEYGDANALLTDTHGLYIPMKKKLFKGQYLKKPEWAEKLSDKAKKICLLLGQWENCKGDMDIVESLYGDKYNAFLEELVPYTQGEDPFLYSFKSHGKTIYSLASTENTWECVDVSLDDPLWEKYIEIFIEVINESEALFTYSGKERLLAQWRGEELFWSETVRRGMMRTLIMKGFYRKTENCQVAMDQLVDRILGYIQDARQWRYISQFWTDLCEISPKAVLRRMDKEFYEPTGLICLFEKQSGNPLFERDAYIDILWGIEQFLTQKEFVWDALRWLLRLDNCNYTYSSNSPKSILEKVFCPWYNFSAIRQPKEKIVAAKLAYELSGNAWQYLCDAISHNGNNMVGTLSVPKYRDHLSEQELTNDEYQAVFQGYFRLLLEHMEFSVDRWKEILTLTEDLPSLLREEAFMLLLNELTQMSDDEIIKVKDHIRDILYRHRYYSSSSWAMQEEQLQEYEQLLNEIHTSQPEYEYEFLFRTGACSPLLYPVPYEAKRAGNKENEIETDQLIQEKMEEFQKNGYRLELLADICAEGKGSTLGKYLARFWGTGEWDLEIFKILLNAQRTKEDAGEMAIHYMTMIFKNDVSRYPDIIFQIREWGYADELLSKIYRTEAVWTEGTPLVEQAPDEIKELFWREPLPLTGEAARWAAKESKQYGDLGTFLSQLYWLHSEKPLKAHEIYSYFEGIELMPPSSNNQIAGWYVQQFLEILQQEFLYDDERCIRISQIEIYFVNVIGRNHMKCFSRIVSETPEVFVQLIAGIYKRDHESEESKSRNSQIVQNMYTVYDKTHFCPAERNGSVDETELRRWVEQFRRLLKENDQESYFGSMLGRLFSFSPAGEDGHKPCEAVRIIIEECSDDEITRAYVTSVLNQRGAYSPSAGTDEMRMAREFQREAEYFRPRYPQTAEIFNNLYDCYKQEFEHERLEAENGRF